MWYFSSGAVGFCGGALYTAHQLPWGIWQYVAGSSAAAVRNIVGFSMEFTNHFRFAMTHASIRRGGYYILFLLPMLLSPFLYYGTAWLLLLTQKSAEHDAIKPQWNALTSFRDQCPQHITMYSNNDIISSSAYHWSRDIRDTWTAEKQGLILSD